MREHVHVCERKDTQLNEVIVKFVICMIFNLVHAEVIHMRGALAEKVTKYTSV